MRGVELVLEFPDGARLEVSEDSVRLCAGADTGRVASTEGSPETAFCTADWERLATALFFWILLGIGNDGAGCCETITACNGSGYS
jgi:hypothetical protein